jgi:hypothetical protein
VCVGSDINSDADMPDVLERSYYTGTSECDDPDFKLIESSVDNAWKIKRLAKMGNAIWKFQKRMYGKFTRKNSIRQGKHPSIGNIVMIKANMRRGNSRLG